MRIKAFDVHGRLVEEVELSFDDYYEDLHALIDDDSYRASREIIAIEGRIYDQSGTVVQQFRNRYSNSGAYAGGRIIHADGTVTED